LLLSTANKIYIIVNFIGRVIYIGLTLTKHAPVGAYIDFNSVNKERKWNHRLITIRYRLLDQPVTRLTNK